VGGACGTLQRRERSIQDFGGKARRILGRLAGGCGLDSVGSGLGPVAGYYECGNEPSRSGATDLVT
jgi:hypothetical protein